MTDLPSREELERLAAEATQGEFITGGRTLYSSELYADIFRCGHGDPGYASEEDAAFLAALVNLYRAGRLRYVEPGEPTKEEIVEVLRKVIEAARILQANSEGCAVQHCGEDFAANGWPGWLLDTALDIQKARTLLSRMGG